MFNDKQTITADPTDASYVYAVWDRLVFPGSERASVVASFRTSAFSGPAWFARSTDAGLTWEPARQIGIRASRIRRSATRSSSSQRNPGRHLHGVQQRERKEERRVHRPRAALDRQGRHLVGPLITSHGCGTIGVTDPETGADVRGRRHHPDIAVDPASGRLYAVWQDASFDNNQADAIAFSQSLDGGLTWSRRSRSTRPRPSIPIGDQQAFTPSVDVSANGTVAVTYYDFRNNTKGRHC